MPSAGLPSRADTGTGARRGAARAPRPPRPIRPNGRDVRHDAHRAIHQDVQPDMSPDLSPDVQAYYALGMEQGRLGEAPVPLEGARTRAILERPPPPATVLDVGGGAGAYAFWLADRGYTVHLIDPVPLHLEQARRTDDARAAGAARLASIVAGDARTLDWPDGRADAVLMLGPLYHLTDRVDRVRALAEARRVARGGGLLVAAAISRWASLVDGLGRGLVADPAFGPILDADLRSGQHRNPTGNPQYFTTAYFHTPEELRDEIAAAGWQLEDLLAVEGPGVLAAAGRADWPVPPSLDHLLPLIARVEREPALLGLSPHWLALARA